jgi:hypothetical protein
MANKDHKGAKKYVVGTYEGSKQNGGRKIEVTKYKGKDGKWHTTSENKARADYEKAHGKGSAKGKDVDHKDNNKNNDSKKNLRAIPKSENVAKENKRRAGKK